MDRLISYCYGADEIGSKSHEAFVREVLSSTCLADNDLIVKLCGSTCTH